MPEESASFFHRPVMVREIVAIFASAPEGIVVDATVGAGGHARVLLEECQQLGILGLDQDDDALVAASAELAPFGERATVRRARFDRLGEIVREEGLDRVSGVLFDLGVSSPQLDHDSRGFSYRNEAPLDMRMDRTSSLTAAEVINDYTQDELADVLSRYGDERYAGRIARAIVVARPVHTTTELAEIVRGAIPAPARRRGGHPAKRSFQAVRIEVNHELDVLPTAVDQAIEVLAPRGRCAVLAYHSGEDRIVKARFRRAADGGCTCPAQLPCTCGAQPTVRLLKRGAWKPDPDEIERNPRAQSARLRAVEKLEQAA